MKTRWLGSALATLLVLAACSATDDRGVAGPSGDGTQLEPGVDGEGGSDGELSESDSGDVACGDLELDCCTGGECDVGLFCAADGSCQLAGEPEPGPEPEACGDEGMPCCEGTCLVPELACAADGICRTEDAPPEPPAPTACGLAGQACCSSGDACPGANGKAQCCTECAGAPSFSCLCGEALVPGGMCKLCCVVCSDGHKKTVPEAVSTGQTCQQVAADWCQKNRNVGAADGSGWRNDCG